MRTGTLEWRHGPASATGTGTATHKLAAAHIIPGYMRLCQLTFKKAVTRGAAHAGAAAPWPLCYCHMQLALEKKKKKKTSTGRQPVAGHWRL